MGIADHSIVTFRISGDDLIPSEITTLMRCEPTESFAKGDVRVGSETGNRYVRNHGLWRLSAEDRYPEDLVAQFKSILDKLPDEPALWAQLRSKYVMDFFCGVFMGSSNDGLDFGPDILSELSKRGIALSLDIYDLSDE